MIPGMDPQTKALLKIGTVAFCTAGVGVAMGFIGEAIDEMVFARAGLVITALSICVGFVVVSFGIIKNAKSAVVDGLSSLPVLRKMLNKVLGRREEG
jgi:hypothetical protein